MPLTFTTDSGTATSLTNSINLLGGTGIATAGAGDTVTINSIATPPPTPGVVHLHTITFNNTTNSYNLTPYLTGSGYTSFEFYTSQATGNGVGEHSQFQVSTDGGATFISSGYFGFELLWEYGTGGGGLQAPFKFNGTSSMPVMSFNGVPTDGFVQAVTRLDGWLNPLGVCTTTRGALAANNGNNPMDYQGMGQYRLATVNGLRLFKTANFNTGTFSIYGITK